MCWLDLHGLTLTCVRGLWIILEGEGFWLWVIEIMRVV